MEVTNGSVKGFSLHWLISSRNIKRRQKGWNYTLRIKGKDDLPYCHKCAKAILRLQETAE